MFLEIFLLLYGVAILGILLVTWLIIRRGYEKLGKQLRKYSLIALGVLILTFHLYDWWSRHHYYEFALGDKYAVELELIEYDSFLDYPVYLEFEIENRQTHETFYFEISSGDGPYFRFLTSQSRPDILIIRGYGSNTAPDYWVDLTNKEVLQNYKNIKHDSEFNVVAELTGQLELVEK